MKQSSLLPPPFFRFSFFSFDEMAPFDRPSPFPLSERTREKKKMISVARLLLPFSPFLPLPGSFSLLFFRENIERSRGLLILLYLPFLSFIPFPFLQLSTSGGKRLRQCRSSFFLPPPSQELPLFSFDAPVTSRNRAGRGLAKGHPSPSPFLFFHRSSPSLLPRAGDLNERD